MSAAGWLSSVSAAPLGILLAATMIVWLMRLLGSEAKAGRDQPRCAPQLPDHRLAVRKLTLREHRGVRQALTGPPSADQLSHTQTGAAG